MKRFDILVRPRGPLLIGGRTAPRAGADRATARDHRDRLVIPASALRGALRLALERLLRGVGEEVCSAGAAPENGSGAECHCPACRLFGNEGVSLGRLRLADAVLPPDAGSRRLMRPQVAVARQSGTAVAQQLGFFEAGTVDGGEEKVALRAAATLVPLGPDDAEASLEKDLELLRGACRAVRGIGGGKARGLGWVECGIEEAEKEGEGEPQAAASSVPAVAAGGDQQLLRLTFEARAPLHFGRGRPLGSFHPSRRHAPASTVRGALSYALLERQLVQPEDELFQGLVDPEGGVTFGAARLAGDLPLVTRRRCRSLDEHVFDDLPAELLQRLAADRHGVAVATVRPCAHPGCPAPKAAQWAWAAGAARPRVRLRTKTALNRHTGTAMDRRLYSMEVLEPVMDREEGEGGPLRLNAALSGLTAAQAALLARLDGEELWLGGKRSRGLGRVVVRVEGGGQEEAVDPAALLDCLLPLWRALREERPELPPSPVPAGRLPLAIVLTEPWLPDDPEVLAGGPLAGVEGVEALEAFVAIGEEGRFGALEAKKWRAPDTVRRGEVPPRRTAAAGSVWVYLLPEEGAAGQMATLRELGLRGRGRERALGWGRFRLWTAEETVS